ARGQGEGRDVEDWLEAERQLQAESMAPSVEIEPPIAADSRSTRPDSPSSNGEAIPRLDQDQESEPLLRDRAKATAEGAPEKALAKAGVKVSTETIQPAPPSP